MRSPRAGSALIVGAGIGGVAAAIALRQAGWNVRVFERASEVRELGFALVLAPNAMIALRALGLEPAVVSGGVTAERGEIRRADGRLLRRIDARAISGTLGAPTVCVLRPVLHGILLDALGSGVISRASEAAGIDEDAEGVTLILADGRAVRGDVLIGADGVASTVRRCLHPHEPPPRSSGLFALRGVAFDVAHHLGDLSGVQYFGRGVEAGVGRASDRAVYWYLSIPATRVARIGRDMSTLARAVANEFDERLRAIVAETAREDLRLDELVEREPVVPWGRGAITLLGDAAHPMLPHAGQGAAQAIEDAVALGRALAGTRAPGDALRAYEQTRAPRRLQVAAAAARNARVSAVESSVGCWLRDQAIRLAPESVMARSLIAVARPQKLPRGLPPR